MTSVRQATQHRCVLSAMAVGSCVLVAACHTPSARGTASSSVLYSVAAKRILPLYPEGPKAKGLGGVVVAQVVIRPNGSVDSASLVASPNAELGAAVKKAVLQWTFMQSSTSFEIEGTLAFRFEPKTGSVSFVGGGAEPEQAVAGAAVRFAPDLRSAHPGADAVVLDIRARRDYLTSHDPMALNIPYDELFSRARRELNRRSVTIDCRVESKSDCVPAADLLRAAGVADVVVAGGGSPAVDQRVTVDGTIARGLELLRRKAYLAFMTEIGAPDALNNIVVSYKQSLDEFVMHQRQTSYFELLRRLLDAAGHGRKMFSGDRAIFQFSSPVDGHAALPMFRVEGKWHVGL